MDLLGMRYDNISLAEAVARAADLASEDRKASLFFLNADCLRISMDDPEYAAILQSADLVLPDGIGISLATRWYGGRMTENCNGTDFSPRLLRELARRGISCYFLGAREGVAEKAAKAALRIAPGLLVAGTAAGYFTDDAAVIGEINRSGASVLFVAMGVPRQEKWIARNRRDLMPRLCLGVGALFDFLSETVPRAPVFLRRMHLEWLWRLFQEPRRMVRRYLVDGIPFMLSIMMRRGRLRNR
jgi:exopolysaccharide biosynthesis WecB/TagA/CpsF family protein